MLANIYQKNDIHSLLDLYKSVKENNIEVCDEEEE